MVIAEQIKVLDTTLSMLEAIIRKELSVCSCCIGCEVEPDTAMYNCACFRFNGQEKTQ